MKGTRLIQLDFLRGCAALLVMGHHGFLEATQAGFFKWPAHVWWRLANSGVDLFFVLSGFLIGGLLFQEWKKSGNLDIKRFLIRRGFKIWPSYFFYVFFSIGVHSATVTWGDPWRGLTYLLPNLLHLQNYLVTPITHTWSLSVEEHFYLALPFVLVYIGARRPDWTKAWQGWGLSVLFVVGGIFLFQRVFLVVENSSLYFGEIAWYFQAFQTPLFPVVWGLQLCLLSGVIFFVPLFRWKPTGEFSVLPVLAFSVFFLSAIMRIITIAATDSLHIHWMFSLFATHMRLDGFAVGLLLAWFYVFRPTVLKHFARYRILLVAIALLLMGLDVLLPYDKLMVYAVEVVIFSVACACLLLAMLYAPLETGAWAIFFRAWPTRAIMFVGTYSYTIYLWHVTPVRFWIAQNLFLSLAETPRWVVLTCLHVLMSVFLGWLASQLIEIPFLRLRDRLFPGNARALAG